jgi:hypothetical protein
MRVAVPGQMPRNLLDNLEFKILPRWYLAAFGPRGIGVAFFRLWRWGARVGRESAHHVAVFMAAQEDDRSH